MSKPSAPSRPSAPEPAPDPLDHDGDGRKGGSLPRDLGRTVHAETWVVLLADGERGPRGAVRRVSGAAAAELAGAGLARTATDRDLGIAGIDPSGI